MDTSIIVTIISGLITLAGTILTVWATARKQSQDFRTEQAVMNTKLGALTEEVHKHNGFAERIPVLEEKMSVANHRISDLETKVDKLGDEVK